MVCSYGAQNQIKAGGRSTYDRRNGPASSRSGGVSDVGRVFEGRRPEAAVLAEGRRSQLQPLPELAAGGGGEQCGAVADGAGAVLQLHRSLHHRRPVRARSTLRRRPDYELRRGYSGRRRRNGRLDS